MSNGALEAFRGIAISRTAEYRFSDQGIETDALRDIMALTQRFGACVGLSSHAAAVGYVTHAKGLL